MKLVLVMMDGVLIYGLFVFYIFFNFFKGCYIICYWYYCILINFIIENYNLLFVRFGNWYFLCSLWFVIYEYLWVVDFFLFLVVWYWGYGLICNVDYIICFLFNFFDIVWYILISINWLCFIFCYVLIDRLLYFKIFLFNVYWFREWILIFWLKICKNLVKCWWYLLYKSMK